MIMVTCVKHCFGCFLIAFCLIHCRHQKRDGFVSASEGLTDRSESFKSVDSAKVTTKANSHLVTADSRFKGQKSLRKISEEDSTWKAPIIGLTNASKESEFLHARSQFTTISLCQNTTIDGFISTYNPCSITVNDGQTIVDCSGLSQDNINPAWFPTDTNVILLDNNRLTTIYNCTFSHLRDLSRLSLSGNRIHDIEVDAFSGLNNLEYLNLEYNKLGVAYLYPPNVFEPLRKLKELRIQNNFEKYDGEECFPGNTLGKLEHLESLSVDTVGSKVCFNDEFTELANLQQLAILGNSKYIDEISFQNVRQITRLYMRDILATNVSDKILEPLQNLDILSWQGIRIGVENTLRALKPFCGRNMTVIAFDSVDMFEHDSYASFIQKDGLLTVSKTQYLLQICVRNFTLSGCGIYVIQENALSSAVWDRCLVNLDLSYNPLIGTKSSYFRLLNFKHLESFTLEFVMVHCVFKVGSYDFDDNGIVDNTITPSIPQARMAATQHNDNVTGVYSQREDDTYTARSNKYAMSTDKNKQVADACASSNYLSDYMWITVSESLQTVKLQASIGGTELKYNIKFIGAKSLTYLDVSMGKLNAFRGNITGLDALRTFVLSGNDVSTLTETFFDNFCNLEELFLSGSFLNVDFISRNSARLLMNLAKLKRLDISFNLLNSLATDTFTFNRDLEMLNIAKNRFNTIPFNLENTPHLKVLDVRKNSLSSIESRDRYILDILADQPGGFRLLFSGNDISCDCDNFPFLQWLTTTHVQLDEVNVACTDGTINITTIERYVDVDRFWRKCLGGFFLALAISLFLVMIIGFLVFFFVCKHQIFLKSAILQFFTGYRLKVKSDYNIGVYIGYSENDYAFPCFHLRRFIEDELRLSTYVFHKDMSTPDKARGIVDAINASWRIVLVVTRSFLFQDEWSTFIYTSAVYSQTSENPSRIVVLVDKSLQHHLPPEMLSAVHDDNIIVVPEWELTYELRNSLRSRLIH